MTAASRRALPPTPEIHSIQKIHVIGICGTAMGTLAAMLQERGFTVTGSDAMAYPPMSTWLEARGLTIRDGYSEAHIDDDVDLVVVGNVARVDNPEAVVARARRLPHLSLPEVLRLLFFPGREVLAVTGTHGKTTTSSMLAWILHDQGRDPSFLIGGVTRNFDSNYRLGDGRSFVIEGDEYDTAYFDKVPKFWHYPARAATINNVEFDHADIYPDIGAITHVFRRFAEQIPAEGELWINGDDPLAVECAQSASAAVHTFGLGDDNEVRALNLRADGAGVRFDLFVSPGRDARTIGDCYVPMPGAYNVRNFLGACALARFVGVTAEQAVASIARFEGVVKRQEIVGEHDGILVIDDFAHHPTAVAHALHAIRARFPTRRIWAAFEAKSNTSRRAVFQDDYPPAFDDADRVILSPPWKKDNLPEHQRLSMTQLIADIEKRGKPVVHFPETDRIVEYLVEHARPGDVIVGLSGSSFDGLHRRVLAGLVERSRRASTSQNA